MLGVTRPGDFHFLLPSLIKAGVYGMLYSMNQVNKSGMCMTFPCEFEVFLQNFLMFKSQLWGRLWAHLESLGQSHPAITCDCFTCSASASPSCERAGLEAATESRSARIPATCTAEQNWASVPRPWPVPAWLSRAFGEQVSCSLSLLSLLFKQSENK